jgi:hypothetical protein
MMKEETSTAREASLSKTLCRIMLYSVKVIPMVISGIYVLNTVLSYFYIDLPVLSYIVQFLFIAFMLIASYAFKFCKWHRMFIYYILLILILNIIDYHVGIPISNRGLLLMYVIITGIFMFYILYLKFKRNSKFSRNK